MPSSFMDYSGRGQGKTQAWQQTWTPGPALGNLYSLYPSQGNVTISAPTNIPTVLDGPIRMARYGALTVNAALSVTNRCRGLIILADSLAMGAAGSISMTARGAAGSPKWVNQDILIPTSITLSGQNTSYRAFVQWLAANGYAIFDPTLVACPIPGMGDVIADYASWPARGTVLISAAGCGAKLPASNGLNAIGRTGNAGSSGGTGSGGGGGVSNDSTAQPLPLGASGSGLVWGGGPGASGCSLYRTCPDFMGQWGGPGGDGMASYGGGGAGNPGGVHGGGNAQNGGDGTGGVLIIIVRGNVSLTAGHSITANGVAGGYGQTTPNAYGCGGGGSGAGHASLIYSGTLTGTPNITATGGPGGAGVYAGGPGGAGTAQSKTFAQMGWT